ncbi:hypothetical protein BX666DRAFT_1905990 [Dichotomocladium elegans]|nr:hypothetical protein BX666DRAFT_1905990 [Dichotomocladium elegans]
MVEEDSAQCIKDDAMRKFYSDYVGINDPHELIAHSNVIRARLRKEGQVYKCIDRYKFLTSRLSTRFYYPRILELAKQAEAAPYFVDVGCCTGQKRK